MNFSDVLPYSNVMQFSPNSEWLAVVKGLVLTIYDISQLNVVATFAVQDQVSVLEWSPDSQFILCAQAKRGILHAFSIHDAQWTAKINLGASGLTGAAWAPDSRQVLVTTEFQLSLSIWSLVNKSVAHIKNPKFADRGLSFSSEGKFMALAERHECRDYIGIYFTHDWQLVSHFAVDSFDLENMSWTPDDTAIVVYDSSLTYNLLVYSPTGSLLTKCKAYDNALGIKSLKISPSGNFIAVGAYDQSVRVYSHISWRQLIEYPHTSSVSEGPELHIYREEEYREGEVMSSRYEMQSLPVKIQSLKVPADKPNPPVGVSIVAWSFDSRYLATRNDNMPNALWIWDMETLALHILLIQKQPIRAVSWSPKSLHLAFSTGTARLFLWSLDGASVCDVPADSAEFHLNKLNWSPDGQCLLIQDKAQAIVVYPQFDYLEGGAEEFA
jgi:WD40 repeat protein